MPVTRRRFLQSSTLMVPAFAAGSAFAQAPAVVTSERMRPQLASGVQAGDVAGGRGVIWSRSDRPARMWVEWATNSTFSNPQRIRGPYAMEDSDYTARLDLTGLPPGQEIFYRVTFEDLAGGALSAPAAGHFRTPPAGRRDIRFVWSGDTCGQGWGINEAAGGMKCYETMRAQTPDFFIHSGDTIYADGVIKAEVKMPDGTFWKNLVTEEKSHVAETLNDFRGAYRYNLMDANVRRFGSEVAQIWQWDDHEVLNNWSSSKNLMEDKRYKEKSIALLSARAARAFHEYMPIAPTPQEAARVYRKVGYGPLLDIFFLDERTYRGPNSDNRQTEMSPETAFMGRVQLDWLKRELMASRATWKVIAADMPLSLLVYDDAAKSQGSEAVAQGDGPPLGRELEFAELLSFIKRANIRNTVWLTADVHYTAAHYYDPNKAQFQDFEPFWEFISGPIHAGTWHPQQLDNTFGPRAVFQKGCSGEQPDDLAPCFGLQFFGQVAIDGASEVMTVTLKDVEDRDLWSTRIEPRMEKWSRRSPSLRS